MLNLDIGPLFAVYLSWFLRVHGRDSQMPGSSIGKAALVANIAHGLSGGAADEEAEFDSPETVEGIASALRKAGLDVIILEAGPDLPEKLKEEKIGFVFNIAEGRGGRDREAQVPALLSLLGIPFSGSDALVMSLTLDKALTKRFAASFGIRTAPFFLVSPGGEKNIPDIDYPVIVKPNAEGSGKGVSEHAVAEDRGELGSMLFSLFREYGEEMLVESFLPGREFTVGLLGNGGSLRAFPPMEIVYEHPTQGNYAVYSYKIKKEYKKHVHYECPADIPAEKAREMEDAAKKIFRELGCCDLARVDFRMDKEGNPCFLEINPLPGLAPGYSDYPMAAEACGIGYDELIRSVLSSAMDRLGKQTLKG